MTRKKVNKARKWGGRGAKTKRWRTITVRVDDPAWKHLLKAAKADSRTVSGYIWTLILKDSERTK